MYACRPKQMRTRISVVPVKEICHVNMTFPMEDLSAHYAAAPAGQVAQLIGHKGLILSHITEYLILFRFFTHQFRKICSY